MTLSKRNADALASESSALSKKALSNYIDIYRQHWTIGVPTTELHELNNPHFYPYFVKITLLASEGAHAASARPSTTRSMHHASHTDDHDAYSRLLSAPPSVCPTSGSLVHHLLTLSLEAQAEAVLSVVRREGHAPSPAAAALLDAARSTRAPPLVRALASSSAPECPEFLYTDRPAFPWAPSLVPMDAAAAGAAETATQHIERRAAAADEDDSILKEAQKRVCEAFAGEDASQELLKSAAFEKAFDTVLARAAAARSDQQLRRITEPAGLCSLAPAALEAAVVAATTGLPSAARCSAISRGLLLPAALALDSPPSHSLVAAATALGAADAAALVDGCLAPILAPDNTNQYNAELVVRLMQSGGGVVPLALMESLITAVTASRVLCDSSMTAVLAIIEAKPPLTGPALAGLVAALAATRAAGGTGAAPIRLQKLLSTVAKAYAGSMDAATVAAAKAAATGMGVLARTALTALEKA